MEKKKTKAEFQEKNAQNDTAKAVQAMGGGGGRKRVTPCRGGEERGEDTTETTLGKQPEQKTKKEGKTLQPKVKRGRGGSLHRKI